MILHRQEPQQPQLLRHSVTHREVSIYGGGASLRLAPFTDSDKWSVGSLYNTLQDKVDLYFCFHNSDPIHQLSKLDNIGYIDRTKYPLDEIIKKFGSRYFTNSISYMIAYAIYKRYKKINLYGVDVNVSSEYVFERPSIAYWCGVANGRGITVNWSKINPLYLYGYEGDKMEKILEVIDAQKEIAIKELKASVDRREQDQWRGYLYALQKIAEEVKS